MSQTARHPQPAESLHHASMAVVDLSDLQRQEARTAIDKLVELGLGAFSVRELHAALDRAPTGGTWRNIRYGTVGDRRLQVYTSPDHLQPERDVSVPFGERMRAVEQRTQGSNIWLRLGGNGAFAGKWVLAREGDTWNCACFDTWRGHNGRIPSFAFEGQEFPSGMYLEGYAGSARICLVSASGEAFWREVHIELLFRDIATSTVFERQWGGDANFTDWVAYYAGNVATFGQLRTATPKRLVVTVKHTSRWRKYLPGRCVGPELEAVRIDIGKAQAKECQWLHSMKQRWDLHWEQVEFVTAFSFLTKYCRWTNQDCWQAAVQKLTALASNWARTGCKKRAHALESAVWCLDEAFERHNAESMLSEQESSDLRRMLLSLTRKERNELLHGAQNNSLVCWMQQDICACAAADCGWTEALERLLDQRADIHAPDSTGRTLAHRAAREGHTRVLTLLLSRRASPDLQDNSGRTPAHVAAECGQLWAWEKLKHCTGDVADTSGVAAREVHRELEERVSRLSVACPDDAQVAVLAAEMGDAAALQMLQCKGQDLDLESKSSASPARAAAREGHVEAVRVLAELGLELNSQDEFGKSLAHDAASSGQYEVLRLLTEQGANLNLKDKNDEAPVHLAAKEGHVEAVKVLLAEHGAELNTINKHGEALAHWAASGGHTKALKLLADRCVNLNVKNERGMSPTHLAAGNGCLEALTLLADRGCDLNARDVRGETPTFCAARKDRVEALRLLADKGADLNLKDNAGDTARFCAARFSQSEKLLLEMRAD